MASTVFTDHTTIILAAWLNDINNWTYNGTFQGTQVKLPNGTVGAPALSWTNDLTSGLYRNAANDFRLSVAGADVSRWTNGPSFVLHAGGSLVWGSSGVTSADVGLARAAANTLDIKTGATLLTQFQVSHTALAVNFLSTTGSVSGAGQWPALYASGSDASISLGLVAKGASGFISFATNGATEQFRVSHTASAVNYCLAQGSSTGNQVGFGVTGTDTNIGFDLYSKGTGSIRLRTNLSSVTQFSVAHTATAVNYIEVTGAVTGQIPGLYSQGTDTNIGLGLSSKGTGAVRLFSGVTSRILANFVDAASAVNWHEFAPSATGNPVAYAANGSDTNVGLQISSRGTGTVSIMTGSVARNVAQFLDVASSVNFFQFSGGATAVSPKFAAAGTDTNVSLDMSSKGTGAIGFYTNGFGVVGFSIAHTASGVNSFQVQAATAGNPVSISPIGSDTNIEARLSSKGTGAVRFMTGSSARVAFQANDTASSVNYITVIPSATGNPVRMTADGTDTNLSFLIDSKGTGQVIFRTSAAQQLVISDTPSATRSIQITGSNGGNPVLSTTAGNLAITPSVEFAGATMVQNSQSTAYTLVAADANKHLLHPTADNNARTFTIPANASVAYAIGTAITFVNQINTLTIAINSDTLVLQGTGLTGSRTLANNGVATALKVAATVWIISGTGLT